MSSPPRLDPDEIARKSFVAGFRGYEQQEVRAYLHELASTIREQQAELFDLQTRVAELEPLAAQRDSPIDSDRLYELVGEETARVLEAARSAADEIRAKAAASAERVVKEATEEAKSVRTAADEEAAGVLERAGGELERKTTEAEAEATKIIDRATRDAKALRDDAEADRNDAIADATARREEAEATATEIVAKAQQDGRTMVQEAQLVRERVLKDLARRRLVARSQVERLNAGRERLLEAYDTVRRTLDEATSELHAAVGEARTAADAAAHAVESEPEPTLEELEEEVAAAGIRVSDLTGAGHAAPIAADTTIDEAVPDEEPTGDETTGDADDPTSGAADEADDAAPAGPVEGPPDPIVLPRSRRRGLLRREPEESKLLPPAELVPLREAHEVEEVRVLDPAAAERSEATDDDEGSADEPTGAVTADTSRPGDGVEAGVDDLEPDHGQQAEPEGDDEVDEARPEEPEQPEPAGEAGTGEEDPSADGAPADVESPDAGDDDDVAATDVEVEAEAAEESEIPDAPEGEEALVLVAVDEREDALSPLRRDLGRRLKRVLADEQNELLDAIRREGADDVLGLLPSAEDHALAYHDAATPPLALAAAAGAQSIGVDAHPDCDEIAAGLANAVIGPLRDRIRRAADEAAGDVDELDTRLRACYREWKTSVLGEAGEDALVGAWSRGLVVSAPGGCGLRWLVAPGSPPCPDADDNALAGVVTAGEGFPTGDRYPPAHPGCRCLVVAASQ